MCTPSCGVVERGGGGSWQLLTDTDKEYCIGHGYEQILRGCGIAGMRYTNQVKCLHTHYAHYLATGQNIVGEWVQAALDNAEDATACGVR